MGSNAIKMHQARKFLHKLQISTQICKIHHASFEDELDFENISHLTDFFFVLYTFVFFSTQSFWVTKVLPFWFPDS